MDILDADEPQGDFANIEQDQQDVNTVDAIPEQPENEIDTLPEKFRGKGINDLAKIIQDQEVMIGRQANEVGEVRKLADELLKAQLLNKPVVEKPQEIDFFENPQEAIRQAVENNPKVLAAEQYNKQAQMDQAKRMLIEKHPDFGTIVQDVEFANWVKSSPIRTQLYNMAESYDVNAADELLSTFKQLKGVKTQQSSKEEVESRNKMLKSASVDAGGTGESSKKIYRSRDIINLRIRDPQQYDARSEEFQRAYAEDRVR